MGLNLGYAVRHLPFNYAWSFTVIQELTLSMLGVLFSALIESDDNEHVS